MLILGLSSSTARVSVAVGDGERVLASAASSDDRRHAEDLMPMVVDVLGRAGCEVADLQRLAVDVGPGRFTGLRVGVATARALALALDLEVVPASSLELLARAEDARPLGVIIDARRNEVFQQVYTADGGEGPATVGRPGELLEALPPGAVLVGDGADRYSEIYDAGGEGRTRLEGREPSAAVLVAVAAERSALPGRSITPLYLRDPDVQINIRTRP